jgi:hypothetical protein
MSKTANKLICWKEARVRALWVRAQKAHHELECAKARFDEVKSELKDCLQDQNELKLDGRPILVRQIIKRHNVFDYDAFQVDHPRLAKQYWTTPKPYERLEFKW